MQLTGNTILITGGGSGIGRALAEQFHARGNQVIISGRRQSALDEATAANPGMAALTVDMTSADSIHSFASELVSRFPNLNAVLHNAGIMQMENLLAADSLEVAENTLNTNLLGPLRLTAALLPTLQKQPHAAILTVTSGLAFVPMAPTPTYSATKAALHSWTESLRYQLRQTKIQVIELVPPYVQTGLMGDHQREDPRAMPLADYISETMSLLESQPDAHEILVGRVLPLRFAEGKDVDTYEKTFRGLNDAIAEAMANHG